MTIYKEISDLIDDSKIFINSYLKLELMYKIETPITINELVELKKRVEVCNKCSLRSRTNSVFGDGSFASKLMFVGEAPGYEEDKQGIPFVGRAGILLNELMKKKGILRKDVYIANVVKCRPPNNRYPLPNEISECIGYLKKQIDIVSPKVICALGACAAKTLLNTSLSIGKLRNTVHHYENNILLVATYHPSYCLRNPSIEREILKDLQLVVDLFKR